MDYIKTTLDASQNMSCETLITFIYAIINFHVENQPYDELGKTVIMKGSLDKAKTLLNKNDIDSIKRASLFTSLDHKVVSDIFESRCRFLTKAIGACRDQLDIVIYQADNAKIFLKKSGIEIPMFKNCRCCHHGACCKNCHTYRLNESLNKAENAGQEALKCLNEAERKQIFTFSLN